MEKSEIYKQTEKALQLLDIQYKANTDYIQLSCPFSSDPESPHKGGDKNPSFIIYPSKDFAICYGCNLRFKLFDLFDKYAKFINKTIDLKYLEMYVHISEDVEDNKENYVLMEDILKGFHKDHPETERYLKSRNINPEYLGFDVLYDKEYSNIVVPIRDIEGNLVGATGRNTKGSEFGKHHHYFGILTGKCVLGVHDNSKSCGIIVEGMTDYLNAVSKINELKLDYNVYATLTCNMTDWQAKNLTYLSKPLYLCWDMDKPAMSKRPKAIEKLSSVLWKFDCHWNFKDDKGNIKDVGDFTSEEFSEIF